MRNKDCLLESIYDGTLLIGCDGVITDANRQAAEFLGMARDKIVGHSLTSVFPALDGSAWEETILLTESIPFSIRTEFSAQKESMQLYISRIEGEEQAFCVLFRPDKDSTESAEERLEVEIKFLTLFEHSTDGLALFEATSDSDERPRLIMCNESYVRMAGRSREELMASNIDQLIEPVSKTTGSSLGNPSDDFEVVYSWMRPDGEENYITSRTVPVELGDRKYVYSINHDITARRHIEEMFRREHCAVENAGTGIAILDTNFILTYANPAAVSMFGFDYSGEILGAAAIRLWSDALACQNLLQKVLTSGETVRAEFVMVRKDNAVFDAEVSVACNFDNDGIRKGLVLSFVDISDRKSAQMQKAMIASLGAACHHLGQPAQILMANLSMLKMNYDGDTELIDACEEAVDRIGELLHKFNSVTEYRTVPYAQGQGRTGGDEILDI